MSIISISDLFFSYQKDIVLSNINLEIKNKDFLALIGPNGGGKSTLLKLILGIHKPSKGSVKILSENQRHLNIGYVPQNTNININFPVTVLDIVLMGLKRNNQGFLKKIFSYGYNNDEIDNAKDILDKVGIGDLIYNKISSLSGGQRQKVMIARALCTKAEILLLDEPTANIDIKSQNSIYELLKELNKKISIIVVSHDITFVFNYVNKVAYINKNLTFHDISHKKKLQNHDEHFCEVEMFEMMKG